MSDWHNRIRHLEEEHHRLDKRIDGLESTGVFDDVTLEVLKKQRLHIKDEIVKIKSLHEEHINGQTRA